MSWFDDFVSSPLSVATLGISGRKERKERERQEAMANNAGNERSGLLREGLQQGREAGERIYGQSQKQTGADVQDIVKRRRANIDTPSRAESAIRSQGQNIQRRMASKGASDAQQRQAMLETEQRTGIQGDVDRERRLQDFQSLVGSIVAGQSALEPAYGQLSLASQNITPEARDSGLLGSLFDGLGL
jgi:hypothetical protein